MTMRHRCTITSMLVVGVSLASSGPSMHGQSLPTIELMSVTTSGLPGGGQDPTQGPPLYAVGPQKISADNRYVVFASASDQLVPGDANGRQDIFVRDRQAGTTTIVSRALGGVAANNHSGTPVISANGRYVAFTSFASNLAPGDTNGTLDVFVTDLQTGTLVLASRSSGGAAANYAAYAPSISADGRFVAFESASDSLVPGDTNVFNEDVFVRDMVLGTTERVSLRPDSSQIEGANSTMPSLTADGRRIAFAVSSDPRSGPTPSLPPNLHHGIYVRDLTTNQTILVSARPDGTPAARLFASDPVISANGRYVSFAHSEDLDPNAPDSDQESDGPYSDVFVRDLQTSVTSRVSLPFPGGPAEESGGQGAISADGRYVAYSANDPGGLRIRDRLAGTTTLITAPGGAALDDFTYGPAISNDGRLVYFESYATNLVANDTNGLLDAFVYVGPPQSGADLSLTLNANPVQPPLNTDVTLILTVSNGGPDDASGVGVRVPLPAGLTFVTSSGSGSYASATGVWTVGALASGANASLAIVGHFTATSALTVTGQLSAASPDDPDSTPDNDDPSEDDQKSVVLSPDAADLSLALSAPTTTPALNSNITLTTEITNSGPGNATGVAARIALPSGLTFVSANPAATYIAATGIWTPPGVPNGATVTLRLVARVTSSAAFDVVAEVSAANESDPDSTPDNHISAEDDQESVRLTPVAEGIVVNDAGTAITGTDGKCTLIEAITAANADLPSGNAVGECAGGSGPDTIHLRALNPPYTFSAAFVLAAGPNALPAITSDITIDGGGAAIQRNPAVGTPPFRLFYVAASGRLALINTRVRNGVAASAVVTSPDRNGGGLLSHGVLELDASDVSNNTADCYGGGVAAASGSLVLRGGTIVENNASTGCAGGGVFAGDATMTLRDATVRSNSARDGGGVAFFGPVADVTTSVIEGNSAAQSGGGILAVTTTAATASLSIAGSRIVNNVAGTGDGGGIANGRLDSLGSPLTAGVRMTITNTVIGGNRTSGGWGGGIANAGAVMAVAASTISDNQGSGKCGAGAYNSGQLTLDVATVTRNTAGGGVCSVGVGALTVVNSTIGANTNPGPGGGITLFFSPSATIVGTSIIGNSASDGGGLYSLSGSTLTLDNTLVRNNLASAAGAGVYIWGGSATIGNNTRVIGNIATTVGGGMVVNDSGGRSATLIMMDGIIEGNVANGPVNLGGGGGIAHLDTNPASAMTLNGVVIRNNGAPNGDGGGIFNRGVLRMTGGELRGNTAQSGGGLGNGISATLSGGTVTFTDVAIEDNMAVQYGGGIFDATPTVVGASNTIAITRGGIRNNRAIFGGGIFVRPSAIVRVTAVTLAGNTATGGGGAIHSSGWTTVAASTLSGNVAPIGAGLRVVDATTDIVNTTISGNRATTGAGAIYLEGAIGPGGIPTTRVNLTASTIADNTGLPGGIGSTAGYVRLVSTILAANRQPDTTFAECRGMGGSQWEHALNVLGADASCVVSGTPTEYTIDPATVFTTTIGSLANHGGPTATHALLPGSFAIDAGDSLSPGVNDSCPATDQRGVPRLVDGDGNGGALCDIGAFEQQTPQPSPAATLASLAPASAPAGSGGGTLTLIGSAFSPGSVAHWNGSPRTTRVDGPTQLTLTIPASDLGTTADIGVATVTVVNPGAGPSNPLPFTILGPRVSAFRSQIVPPGTSATVSRVPTAFGQAGVSATLANNDPASSAAVVTVATYSSLPVGGTIFAAGGLFDVQVIGADPTDSIDVRYYYPSTVTGGVEASLQLRYWTGAAWAPVVGSGGAPPVKNPTDNLDGTISGGRVTVTLDATSTPTIMSLSGTVFALAPAATDGDPPATTVTANPRPNANGWNKTTVSITLEATDTVSAIAGIEISLDGSGWKPYSGPISIAREGVHGLRFRARDAAGNVEPARSASVKIDKTAPLAFAFARPLILWPPDGQLVDVDISVFATDFLSGTEGFRLVSVVSNDPKQTPDDIAGWMVGTADTEGRLRAESAGRGHERLYVLTYEAVDRAGNNARATATVLVLNPRRW